ncbi:apolipoprotein L5 [Rhynchonycteris naso]
MTMVPAGTHSAELLRQSSREVLAHMTREEMYNLVSNPHIWEAVMVELRLERDEASMLYYILVQELMRREEWAMPCENLTEEERMFLFYFPLQRSQMKNIIKELNTIADEVDRTHRMLTSTSLVASSTGAVSAAMTIVGIALAPVTGGGSLILSTAGQGLGVAAFVTNILTNVLENRSNSAARDRASRLEARPTIQEAGAGGGIHLSEVRRGVPACAGVLMGIRQLRAYQMAQVNPSFLERVRNFMATSRVPFWRAGGVQGAVQNRALTMAYGARMLSAAGAGFLLVQEVNSIRQTWRHLEEGARAETAMELRTCAMKLEQELHLLSRRYKQIILKQARSR